MTREETKELLMMIRAIYPNFNVKPEEMTATINAWHLMLEEYPVQAANAALKIYVKTNNTGYAPSVSQIINSMYAPGEHAEMTEGEAWALVKKAISDSSYNSKERFAELPDKVQKAIGGAEMLRQWAMTDSSEVNTVIMSNFQRAYRSVIEKKTFEAKVPAGIAAQTIMIEGGNDEASN